SGVRIRVLVQDYPNTPGLAIKEYWGLGSSVPGGDDKYVVLVADDFGGKGNLLNFNVSPEVDLLVSPAYFSRLSGKYGTKFYVRDRGEDIAIMDAVEDLAACLVGEEGMCSVVNASEALLGLKFLGRPAGGCEREQIEKLDCFQGGKEVDYNQFRTLILPVLMTAPSSARKKAELTVVERGEAILTDTKLSAEEKLAAMAKLHEDAKNSNWLEQCGAYETVVDGETEVVKSFVASES
ncbi:hypothetical protein TrRE_jg12306, partial [Triparma retinervis]